MIGTIDFIYQDIDDIKKEKYTTFSLSSFPFKEKTRNIKIRRKESKDELFNRINLWIKNNNIDVINMESIFNCSNFIDSRIYTNRINYSNISTNIIGYRLFYKKINNIMKNNISNKYIIPQNNYYDNPNDIYNDIPIEILDDNNIKTLSYNNSSKSIDVNSNDNIPNVTVPYHTTHINNVYPNLPQPAYNPYYNK